MQQDGYIIYGSEYSPFSIKVRSYFRYKKIPHEWRPRNKDNFEHYKAHAKLPLVPLIIAPDGSVLQDSTPIIEKMEEIYPAQSIHPEKSELSFLSALLEEYGDEWVNKPMFHYRWWHDVDQIAVAKGLADSQLPNDNEEARELFAKQIRERMVPRLSFVGSSEQNKETIENSLDQLLGLLESHFKGRRYLFGGRPSFGDFGLFCQLYGCTQQPTTQKMIEAHPNVAGWISQMLDPVDHGNWEAWLSLAPTLEPLLKGQVGELYMPWAQANAKALLVDEPTFSVDLKGKTFTQDTMKYPGRSFHAIKNRFSKIEKNRQLEEILLSADCLKYLIVESW